MQKYIIGVLIGVIVGFGGYVLLNQSNTGSNQLGGYLTATVTNTTSTVKNINTAVVAAGDRLQRLIIYPLTSPIDCAFGATAVAGTGLHINPYTSTTLYSADITDPNLLGKTVNCIATATTTIEILKY